MGVPSLVWGPRRQAWGEGLLSGGTRSAPGSLRQGHVPGRDGESFGTSFTRSDCSQSAVHPPLKRAFNAPFKAFIRHLSRLLPSTQRSPNGSFLTPPAAAA